MYVFLTEYKSTFRCSEARNSFMQKACSQDGALSSAHAQLGMLLPLSASCWLRLPESQLFPLNTQFKLYIKRQSQPQSKYHTIDCRNCKFSLLTYPLSCDAFIQMKYEPNCTVYSGACVCVIPANRNVGTSLHFNFYVHDHLLEPPHKSYNMTDIDQTATM